ncbi:hypothetical protein B0F90DRAFT_1725070 [Multifurca ochricompacta]|uniref:RRM domain-containing protein n=1 Tax=Multifurca ochricompacta TaxID=376703 RepID=A0AAD4M5B9_9AGAM|nr:hypothetical protein B0F90DRAFT_1725070 [Multifurca ochricompacta]
MSMSSDSSKLQPSSHLSYPTVDAEASTSTLLALSPPSRELLKNRLYVGNLHPTVDEYTLIQIFSKFGKLARLDYLFHKTGAMRGKPRGYAFVEYTNEAVILRGRHIAVTYAHQAPLGAESGSRRVPQQQQDAGRPTTLSLLKSVPARSRTDDKIAQMEAKLQQLAQAPPTGTQPSVPAHPSLPVKPGTHLQPTIKAAPVPLPSKPPPLPRVSKPPSLLPSTSSLLRTVPPRKSNAGLKGVKIVRKKDKTKDEGAGEG